MLKSLKTLTFVLFSGPFLNDETATEQFALFFDLQFALLTIFPKRKETSHSSVCLKQRDIGKVNRFFDIVLHYLCNKNLENNQPRSRKLKMRYLIPATKPRNIPNSAKASSFGMISSWGKILESIFTNKQSGGKGRGERP